MRINLVRQAMAVLAVALGLVSLARRRLA